MEKIWQHSKESLLRYVQRFEVLVSEAYPRPPTNKEEVRQPCKLLGNGIQEDYAKRELSKREWPSTLAEATERIRDVCETNARLEQMQAHPPKGKAHAAAPSLMNELEQTIQDLTQQVASLTAAQPKLSPQLKSASVAEDLKRNGTRFWVKPPL